jgi:hypothetical protein
MIKSINLIKKQNFFLKKIKFNKDREKKLEVKNLIESKNKH